MEKRHQVSLFMRRELSRYDCNTIFSKIHIIRYLKSRDYLFDQYDPQQVEIYLARLSGYDVVVKNGYICPINLSGLEYEAYFSEIFINYMLDNNITPHLPYFYGMYKCPSPTDILSECDLLNIYSEFIHGIELEKMINVKISWKSTAFQIIYTLICFDQLKISHNDLHYANVLLGPIDVNHLYYQTRVGKFKVPINSNFVTIIDFDFSSVDCDIGKENIHERFASAISCQNPKLDFSSFRELGILDNHVAFFDLYIIMCYLYKYPPKYDDGLLEFIDRVFDINEFDRVIYGTPCRKPFPTHKYYKIEDLLTDKYFDEYRTYEEGDYFKTPEIFDST